jgi:hypothetical protein
MMKLKNAFEGHVTKCLGVLLKCYMYYLPPLNSANFNDVHKGYDQ